MVALVLLLGQSHCDAGSSPPVSGPLVARLSPLEELKHVVVAPRPAGHVGQAFNIRGNKRQLGISRAQMAVGLLPLPSRERLSTSSQLIFGHGADAVRAFPSGQLLTKKPQSGDLDS
jgi:hypothetical protein